jgi:hypothetical protein
MLTEVANATTALDGFATFVSEFWTDQPYHNTIGGWNIPPLSRDDLALRAVRLSERLKGIRALVVPLHSLLSLAIWGRQRDSRTRAGQGSD